MKHLQESLEIAAWGVQSLDLLRILGVGREENGRKDKKIFLNDQSLRKR